MPNIELADVCKLSLREIMGCDEEGRQDFRYVEDLVKLALFSNFPQRRAWARTRLPVAFYGAEVEIQTIESNSILYAYLKFHGADNYIFVGVYHRSLRLLEPVPTKREIMQWLTH